MKIQTLIHTALVAEAKPIIGYFGLTCKTKQPYNLYENENIALIVSGMGSENTQAALAYALTLYEPRCAINVGIAGCTDASIAKGTLFCTTHTELNIPFATLSSHEKSVSQSPNETLSFPQDEKAERFAAPVVNNRNKSVTCGDASIKTTLVDMEAEAFLRAIPSIIERYVFKIVSDYCDGGIPSKSDVGNWINKSLKLWGKYVRR